MSVKIRMSRIGRNMTSDYRIVVTDSRRARDGHCIEQIGHYDSSKPFADAVIDETKVLGWLLKGAQASETIKAMLEEKGIYAKFLEQKKAAKKPVAKKEKKPASAKKAAPAKKAAAAKPAAEKDTKAPAAEKEAK
jgi:small subunit ribosomal protein S16